MISIPGKGYEIGATVVTQSQWCEVMGTEPWKGQNYVQEGDDYPAVYVSWDDAVAFCKKLSEMAGSRRNQYRLPTEQEWEYACRGGSSTDYHFGDDMAELGRYAWFDENTRSESYAHRVARKTPNQFGLYDMHGNVWEWCGNVYNEDPSCRVVRGGSWNDLSVDCSAWCRSCYAPGYRYNDIGFRLARTLQ